MLASCYKGLPYDNLHYCEVMKVKASVCGQTASDVTRVLLNSCSG
jgi:hypothetical protein